jgi:hypothetical protein
VAQDYRCVECDEIIEPDDDYTEVVLDGSPSSIGRVHTYLCLPTYLVKHPRH